MTLEAQYMTMLVMSINGAVLGAVHDMYRVVLRHWKFLRWSAPIFDLAFWILAIFLVFTSLMWANHGQLRMYVFVVLLFGYLLYMMFLQRLVVGSTVRVILAIGSFCRALYRGFLLLVIRPLVGLCRMLIRLLRALDRLLKALEQLILWPFQLLWKFLGWWAYLFWKLMKRLLGPLLRPLEPYLLPCVKRAKRILRPVAQGTSTLLEKGKGICAKLTNWLLNRDDHKPKP